MARVLAPLLLLLLAMPAHAEFLPDLPRAVTRTETASRDAPVIELGYDGRAHFALGGEMAIWRWQPRDWEVRWLVGALIAADNAQSRLPWPTELGRWLAGGAIAVQLPVGADAERKVEIAVGLYRQQARAIGDFRLPDALKSDAIAFGGSGYVIDFDLATQRRLGPLLLTARLNDRVHLPGFALLFGQRAWADVLGDALADNLSHQPSVDLTARWPISPHWPPVWALHGELLVPLDSYVTTRGYVRSFLGVALPGRRGELMPFAAIDVGAGPGLLVNRQELRLALGVRYGPK